MKAFKSLALAALAVALACAPALAQDGQDKGAVKISWEEFRKLLELDRDEFVLSWEEFQKLLAQTGFKYVPAFALKEEKVVLTRSQFTRLLDQMKPPADPVVAPPAEYLVTKSVYRGVIREGSAQFQAEFNLEIFGAPAGGFIEIPLFPTTMALKNVLFDGRPALVVIKNNRHTLTTKDKGSHRVRVDFSMKAQTEQGPWALSFPIPLTAVTVFEVDIPFKGIDVEVAGAQELEITERGGSTHVTALLSPTNQADVRWRKKPQEVERGPAKVYAETTSLLSIEDDALRVLAEVSLSILQNTVSSVVIRVPEGYNVLDVRGSGVEDWREVKAKGSSLLEVLFEYPKQGQFSLSLIAERLLPDSSMAVDFAGFAVPDSVREKGFLGIELKSTSEVTLGGVDGLDKLDVSELPPSLINRSYKPLVFGFKYLRHPYGLVLNITKHEELPVIGTVVDSASGVTLVTEDGKLVHRIIYSVRNTSKQFMELELPAAAQVWSVFVGGEPAKPRFHGPKILIPLNRSAQGATGLAAFEVELVYFERSSRFGWLGRQDSFFPVPDIIVSQMLWSVYLPQGYRVARFGGTVEKEKTARGLLPLLASKARVVSYFEPGPGVPEEGKDEKERVAREADRAKKQFSANLALSEEQFVQQMQNELRFGRRMDDIQTGKVPAAGGILPIRINIPASGQLFRFAKTLVSGEPLTLSCSYLSGGFLWVLRGIALAAAAALLYALRRKIRGLLRQLRAKFRVEHALVLLVLLAVVLWSFSKPLSIVALMASLLGFLVTRVGFRLGRAKKNDKDGTAPGA